MFAFIKSNHIQMNVAAINSTEESLFKSLNDSKLLPTVNLKTLLNQ